MKRSVLVFAVLVWLAAGADPGIAFDKNLPGRPALGPADAPIQVWEISDFQCRHCAKVAPILHEVIREYGSLAHLKVITVAAPGNPASRPAAELALTAGEEGKFWEAYELLFKNQSAVGEEELVALGKSLGLAEGTIRQNLAAEPHGALLDANFELAVKELGIKTTPTIFINGKKYSGVKTADYYRFQINKELQALNIPSPVADVPEPQDKPEAASSALAVPLEMIYPVPKLPPQDSVLKVKVGDEAPDFELPTIIPDMKVRLGDFRGRRNVVLSFVPAAWTPQCSAQWPEYHAYKDELKSYDVEIIGITADNIPTLYSWTVSMGNPWFTIASDFWPHGGVAQRYGVLRRDGTTERAVILIDKEGIIRYIDVHDINGRPDIHVLIAELKKLEP
jgi:peroxiredoxin (alkyl hydroperoxide reductase subunit C)